MNGFGIGPPSSKTSEKIQNDSISTNPSHSRIVFASAGPTKMVSRDSFIPWTFHSVHSKGKIWGWRRILFRLYFCNRAAHSVVHRYIFVGSEKVFNGIVRVSVR